MRGLFYLWKQEKYASRLINNNIALNKKKYYYIRWSNQRTFPPSNPLWSPPLLMKVIQLLAILTFLFNWTSVSCQENLDWQIDTLQSYVDRSNLAYDHYQYKDAINYASLLIEKGREFKKPVYEFLGYDIIGGIYIETNDSIQGKVYSEKALEIAREIGKDSLIAWGTLNLGILYSENKNTYEKAIEYFEESIKINQRLNEHNEVYLTYINLIWTHLDNERPQRALSVLKMAEALPNTELDPPINKIYMELLYGRYYLATQNYGLAKSKLEKVAALAIRMNTLIWHWKLTKT